MKARNMTSVLVTLLLLTTLSVSRASAQGGRKKEPTVFSSGMVGVVPGQTLRVNVVDVGWPRDPCGRVALLIYDAQGEIVAETKEPVELCPGKSAFLDYSPDFTDGKRQSLRAVVRHFEEESYPSDLGVHTLELFDNDTGRSVVVLSPFEKVRERQR